jgi:hypothetical protein
MEKHSEVNLLVMKRLKFGNTFSRRHIRVKQAKSIVIEQHVTCLLLLHQADFKRSMPDIVAPGRLKDHLVKHKKKYPRSM